MLDPTASTTRRVTISKILLLVVALVAAYVASQKPADILFLVSAAFSFAAAAFFPALVLGIFWKRANKWGAIAGHDRGRSGITFYYMVTTQPWMRGIFGVTSPIADHIWWGIQPISAGLWGVPLGFVGDHHRQPAHAGARSRDAGPRRARSLSEPRRRHDQHARELSRAASSGIKKARGCGPFCWSRALGVGGRVAHATHHGYPVAGGTVSWNEGRLASFSASRARFG